eukprot:485832_1
MELPEFKLSWNHIINALKHQLYTEISESLNKIIFGGDDNEEFKIKSNDFSDETIRKILDKLGQQKNQKSLSPEQIVFMDKLIEKARKYDPITQQSVDEIGNDMMISQDFNQSGIIYWLGTDKGESNWRNPAIINNVKVICSSVGFGSKPFHTIVGRKCLNCFTKIQKHSWVMIDLLKVKVLPTHYALRHHDLDICYLRNWYLEASNNSTDGINGDWTRLSVHVNDKTLRRPEQIHKWSISTKNNIMYSQFRIFQFDMNASDGNRLALSGFEIY